MSLFSTACHSCLCVVSAAALSGIFMVLRLCVAALLWRLSATEPAGLSLTIKQDFYINLEFKMYIKIR